MIPMCWPCSARRLHDVLPALCHLWLTVAVLIVSSECWAQRSQALRLVEEGDALLEQGDARAASRLYSRAILADQSYFPAHVRLGVLELEAGSLGNAEGHFTRALRADPANVEAHYYQAIVKREQGRTRPPLTGWLLDEWRESREHFNFVLREDSSYRDVLYQFALLHQYRGDEASAIRLAYDQLRRRPDVANVTAGFFRMGRMLASTARGNAHQWLASLPEEYRSLFQAEILRRRQSLDEAEAILLRLQQSVSSMSRSIVHILLARTYVGRGQGLGAQVQFWAAVEAIRSPADAAVVFEEVKYVLNDEEIAEFELLGIPAEYVRFFQAVWARRDPLPAAATNVRLVEHLHRLNEAEKSFEHYQPRTWFNDPDALHGLQFGEVYRLNHQFNDRGLIFIRHGYPDERIFTSGEGGGLSSFGATTSGSAPVSGGRGFATMEPMATESWRYRSRGELPEMVFHFAARAGGNWRLISAPMFPQALYDRRGWHHIYQEAFQAIVDGNDVDVPRLMIQMQRESQQSVSVALATDRHSWSPEVRQLAVPASVFSFRGENGMTEIDVYYAFPTSPLSEYGHVQREVPVEIGLAVVDLQWDDVVVRRDRKLVRASPTVTDAAIGHFTFSVVPDSYLVSLHVQPEGTPLVGGWKSWRDFTDFSSGQFEVSDLILATTITPATDRGPFTRGQVDVVPTFTRRFSVGRPVHLYYELYNLALDEAGRTSYTRAVELRPINPPRRGPLGLFGRSRRPALTLQTEQNGEVASPVEYFEIDMTSVPPGAYTLVLRVTDRNSREVRERRQDLELVE